MRVVVVGAGVGGLTAAALLLKAGHQVTVLEAHIYPGGCAGTFFHQGYRFDAGATLAGGFSSGGPHARLAELLGDLQWPVNPVDPAWSVHLPDSTITQWADPARWRQERMAAFPDAEPFWRRQESLADIAWDISARDFPWPPQNLQEALRTLVALRPSTLRAAPHLLQSASDLFTTDDPRLRAFVDAQLLIAAQCTSDQAHALYAAAALDLPRRGVCHVRGGMGGIARTLEQWIVRHGGTVQYKEVVTGFRFQDGRATHVLTRDDGAFGADVVLCNLTPWAVTALLGTDTPRALSQFTERSAETWSAFMVYLGVDTRRVTLPEVGHQQVVVDPTLPLGEGNSVFISLADAHDAGRAPAHHRAVTISTHTRPGPWWDQWEQDRPAYEARKDTWTQRIRDAVHRAVPGLFDAADLVLPATPLSFARFTRRPRGMVGGFAQTSLFEARGPQTGVPNVLMVGDSIFPGQSTAGVTLGAMRVASTVLGMSPQAPVMVSPSNRTPAGP